MDRLRALRWIGITAAAFVAILALAVVVLLTIDLARFQDELEEFLGDFTGREVVINGEFQASLGRTVAIRIEDARLGSASWSSAPHMLRVGELEIRFGLWSVFRDTLRIEYLRLSDVEVLIEADADLGLNWSFDPSTGIEEWLASRSVTQYTFEKAEIEDVRLRYGDGWLDEARTLELIRCVLEETEDDFLSLDLDGRLGDFEIAASGLAGPQQSLASGENISLDITTEVGEVQLDLQGSLENLERLTGLAVEFSASGPQLKDVLRAFPIGELPSGAFKVGGRLEGDERPFALSDVSISVGEFSAQISGSVDADNAELDVSASGPDFAAFFGTWTEQSLPAGAFEISGRVLRHFNDDSWAVSEAALALAEYGIESEFGGSVRTDGIDLRLSGSGHDFSTFFGTWTERPLPSSGFEISGEVSRLYSNRVWNLADATARLATGMEFRFNGSLEPTEDYLGVNATLAALGPELGDALALWFDNPPAMGPFSASAQLDKDRDASRWSNVEAMVGGDKHPPAIASGANRLTGTILYEPGDRRRVTGELRTEGFDITPYVVSEDVADAEAGSDEASTDRWFPEVRLPLGYLDVADVDIRLDAERLQLAEFEVTSIGLHLLMLDGNFAADSINAVFRNGDVSGHLRLETGGDTPRLDAELQVRNVIWDEPTDDQGNPVERPLAGADITVSGYGATTTEVLASSNGRIHVEEGAGSMELAPLKALLDAINPPLADEEFINLECYVAVIDIIDGVASSRAMAMQTDTLKVAARGKLNLATEDLDMRFKIVKREGIGVSGVSIVSPLVGVGGTLANPTVTFPTEAGLLALLTDGTTILLDAILDIGGSDKNVCDEARRRANVEQPQG